MSKHLIFSNSFYFIHRLSVLKKTQRFGSWFYFLLQVTGEQTPSGRASLKPEDGSKSSYRKVFFNTQRMDK
jgi:hypothetical protein